MLKKQYSGLILWCAFCLSLSFSQIFSAQASLVDRCNSIADSADSPAKKIVQLVNLVDLLNRSYNFDLSKNQDKANQNLSNLYDTIAKNNKLDLSYEKLGYDLFNLWNIRPGERVKLYSLNKKPDNEYHSVFNAVIDQIVKILSASKDMKALLISEVQSGEDVSEEGITIKSATKPISILLFYLSDKLNSAYQGQIRYAKDLVRSHNNVLAALKKAERMKDYEAWKNNPDYKNLLDYLRFRPEKEYNESMNKFLGLFETIFAQLDGPDLVEVIKSSKKEDSSVGDFVFPLIFYLLDLPDRMLKTYLNVPLNSALFNKIFVLFKTIFDKIPEGQALDILKLEKIYLRINGIPAQIRLAFQLKDNVSSFGLVFVSSENLVDRANIEAKQWAFFEIFMSLLKKLSNKDLTELMKMRSSPQSLEFVFDIAYLAVDKVEDGSRFFEILNYCILKLEVDDDLPFISKIISTLITSGLDTRGKSYEPKQIKIVVDHSCKFLELFGEKLSPAQRMEIIKSPGKSPLIFTLLDNYKNAAVDVKPAIKKMIPIFLQGIDSEDIAKIKNESGASPNFSDEPTLPKFEGGTKPEVVRDDQLKVKLDTLKKSVAQMTQNLAQTLKKLKTCQMSLKK